MALSYIQTKIRSIINTYMLINHNSVHRFDHSLTVMFRYYCLPKNQRLADEEDEDPACVVTVGFNLLREEPRAC